MIDFEEEIERFKPSLDVEAVEDAIVKSDLTDMTDISQQLLQSGSGKGKGAGPFRSSTVPEKKPAFF